MLLYSCLAPIPTKYYKHALMNHRDTTIVMFFLMGGLILAAIVLIILCAVLFVRVRNDTHENGENRDYSQSTKLKSID
jgi:heme/copper-type cytochrome/quinol oxidase subunit 2